MFFWTSLVRYRFLKNVRIIFYLHCFTRWIEINSIADITAEAILIAFYSRWVSRFGVPVGIATNQGCQFKSSPFTEFSFLLGVTRFKTTPYHPTTNGLGLVERCNRTVQTAIKFHDVKNWTRILPIALLRLRVAIKDDSGARMSEMIYGSNIGIPDR